MPTLTVTAYTIAEHIYNGLSWRIRSDFDTSSPFDGDADESRYMYYNSSWQLVEEFDSGEFGYFGDERRREYFYSADYIDAGQVVERMDYSAYGTPRHHCRADLDGDGLAPQQSSTRSTHSPGAGQGSILPRAECGRW